MNTWIDAHDVEWHYDWCQRKDTGHVYAIRMGIGTGMVGGINGAYGPLTEAQVEHVDLLDYCYDDDPALVAWLRAHPRDWRLSLRRWLNPDGSTPY
jgi:hypothetical protein